MALPILEKFLGNKSGDILKDQRQERGEPLEVKKIERILGLNLFPKTLRS